jgi:hypothetical protein
VLGPQAALRSASGLPPDEPRLRGHGLRRAAKAITRLAGPRPFPRPLPATIRV